MTLYINEGKAYDSNFVLENLIFSDDAVELTDDIFALRKFYNGIKYFIFI